MTFSDCLFLPNHSHNLISISKLRQNVAQVNFGQPLSIFINAKATIPFEEHANLYVLKGKLFDLCSFSGENEEAVLWHHRLGHNHFKKLVKRSAHHVLGLSLKNSAFDKLCCCEVCTISKSIRQPVSLKMERKNLQNLVSLPLTFWDRCQLLHLVAIDTRFLLRIATPGTRRFTSSNRKRSS